MLNLQPVGWSHVGHVIEFVGGVVVVVAVVKLLAPEYFRNFFLFVCLLSEFPAAAEKSPERPTLVLVWAGHPAP